MWQRIFFAQVLILLLTLAISCGGGVPGTGPGGNNNGGGGNTGTTMHEVRIDGPVCQVHPEPDACAYVVVNRTQNNNPTVEFKVWATDCTHDITNMTPIAGTERSFYMIEQLQRTTLLPVPNRGKFNVIGRVTFSDTRGEHEWIGNTGCRDIATVESHSRLHLLLGQVR